ncbi:MAG: hypothetical protein KJ956_13625 [Actinobacteria bacterium]|nr:hypothetical protein [Actinomycetota bacterium]
MTEARHDEWLRNDLTAVAAALGAVRLRLSGPEIEAERASLRETIIRHLLPRCGDPESPLVVAVVGPAGSGKSSLVNSLAEARLCATGVIRPGTRYPVFWSNDRLPDTLESLRTALGGTAVQGERRAPERMVVIDTPPPDVEGPAGVRPVDAVLEAADACVFVASGLRYADVSGWGLLDIVTRRGIPVVFVLNKLPPDPSVQRQVREDMARRLAGRGMISRPDPEFVLGIQTTTILRAIGGPAPQLVAMLRKELDTIADPQARLMVSADVVESGLADAAVRLAAIRSVAVEERRLRLGLAAMAADAYRPEAESLRRGAEQGDLADIRGDTDRLVADLVVMATLRAGRAARAASDAWALHPAGAAVVAGHTGLWTHGPDTVAAAAAAVSGWVESLPDRVLEWTGKRRMRRRRLRRLTDLVCRGAVDNDWIPGAKDLRRLAKVDGAVITARKDLGARLETVLDADGVRFTDALGPVVPEAVIARLGPPPAGGHHG